MKTLNDLKRRDKVYFISKSYIIEVHNVDFVKTITAMSGYEEKYVHCLTKDNIEYEFWVTPDNGSDIETLIDIKTHRGVVYSDKEEAIRFLKSKIKQITDQIKNLTLMNYENT